MHFFRTPNRVITLLSLALASTMPGATMAATASVSLLAPLGTVYGTPVAPLINDGSGNLIATICCTQTNTYYNGNLYSVAPDGTPTMLHAFAAADGYPYSSVVRTPDGTVYGGTQDGGANSSGSIYGVAPDGTLTVLHSFAACPNTFPPSNADGIQPNSLVLGKDGALYGTTRVCGPKGGGTIFRLTTTGQFSTLHSFTYNTTSAFVTNAPCSLVFGADGALYGTSWLDSNPYGAVFKLTSGGQFSVLHRFLDLSVFNCPSLMQGSDGNFYGTLTNQNKQGASQSGLVFKMTPAGRVTTLHQFQPLGSNRVNADGAVPEGLIQTSDGNLYGATGTGGQNGAGTLYQLGTSGAFTKLYDFSLSLGGADSGEPTGNLVQGADGALYGMTGGYLQTPAIFKAVISP